jgi:2-polyprenyl-3-methyl-5-hydroxy-6-metoxy-1,4-benzoquinol methylase
MRCRLCESESTHPLGGRSTITVYRCSDCDFVSGQPSEFLSTEARYAEYYPRAPPPAPVVRYQQWLAQAEKPFGPGRLLEVGAGAGGFTRVALARGWQVSATEVSESAAEHLRGTDASIHIGTLEGASFAADAFDLVVSLEVLEHVSAPFEHLQQIHRVTKPGGRLLLTTPSYAGVSRRRLGFGWRVIDPEHLGYFTPKTLARSLRKVGYGTVKVRSRSLDLAGWRQKQSAAEPQFDPHASANLRDQVEASRLLRMAKDSVNVLLGLTGLGDSLLVWAQK